MQPCFAGVRGVYFWGIFGQVCRVTHTAIMDLLPTGAPHPYTALLEALHALVVAEVAQ